MSEFLSTQESRTHKVICHRGLCNIFVENSLEGLLAALYSSDLVELDILLTKDNQLVVFHDRMLSRVTNVSEHPEFLNRKTLSNIEQIQNPTKDWWVRDFTLRELKTLKLKQDDPNRPQLSHLQSRIPTLEEVILGCFSEKNKAISGIIKTAGLLIQIKQEQHGRHSRSDIIMCRVLQRLLMKYNLNSPQTCADKNFPVIVQSFNIPLLSEIRTENYIYQLYDSDVQITQEFLLASKLENTIGIGVTEAHLTNQSLPHQQSLRQICDNLKYQLNYWTLRDDRTSKIPFRMDSYEKVYLYLQNIGVNGYITQFPDKCRGFLNNDNQPSANKYRHDAEPIRKESISSTSTQSNKYDFDQFVEKGMNQMKACTFCE